MTIKWFKSPYNRVILPLTQPQVANQQQQKKSLVHFWILGIQNLEHHCKTMSFNVEHFYIAGRDIMEQKYLSNKQNYHFRKEAIQEVTHFRP